jgi:hypothetical protein
MADLKLNFLNNKLSKEQLEMAQKVAKAAAAMGIDPSFAVSIAFKEGSLNPDTIDHPKSGAIGMMQILPDTGKAYGYSEADLRKPEINLIAGLKNLKESLAYANNKPMLAAVYYHSGPDAIKDQAAGKDLGPNALAYIKKLKEYGTFDAFNPDFKAPTESEAPSAPAAQPEPSAPPPPSGMAGVTMPTTAQDFIRADSEADLKRDEYGLYGLGAGTAVALAPKASQIAAGTLGRTMRAFDMARNPQKAPTGGLPTGGAPTPPPAPPSAPTGGLPSLQGQPVPSVVRQAPATGYGTYNYGVSQGLTDIESGLAKDMTKQAGGVHDLLTQRREALNRLQGMGANDFVENPRFGGIMTQAPSVGGGVRVDPATGVPQSFAMRVPEAGQPAQLAPIPKAPIIPTVPPPLSGLDQVKNMFTGMMRQSMRYLPVVGPPLAGLSIGRDLADIETQFDRPLKERDYTDIGLSTAGILATGASLYPPTFPVAAPLSIGIPAFRGIRRNILAQESDPAVQAFIQSEPTARELEEASRPSFRYARP